MKRSFAFIAFFFCLQGIVAQSPPVQLASDSGMVDKVEVEAYYPGGAEAWKKYLHANLNANVPLEHGAPIGIYTVFCRFIVDKDGTVSNISVENKEGYGMEEEVIRVFRKSGKWVPAMQNQKAVKAIRRQPITFAVVDDFIEVLTTNPRPYTITGPDAELKIRVIRVDYADLEVTASNGSIEKLGNGSFRITGMRSGRTILSLRNTKKDIAIEKVSLLVQTGQEIETKRMH